MVKICCLILLLLFHLTLPARACSLLDQQRFADDLAREGDYGAAAIEYRRLLSADAALADSALYTRWLDAVVRSADPLHALNLTRRVQYEVNNAQTKCVAQLFEGRILYQVENFPTAVSRLNLPTSCAPELQDEARHRLGLSLMRLNKWDEASEAFSAVSKTPSFASLSHSAAKVSPHGKNLPQWSPRTAALLSIPIPGLGYAYARQPRSAVAAFVTNALFIWGTVSAAKKGATGVAMVMGLFSLGWYGGGIYGSGAAAARASQNVKDKFIRPYEIN